MVENPVDCSGKPSSCIRGARKEANGREAKTTRDQTHKTLRVLIATPLGLHGRGGIDRLNDRIVEALAERPELNIRVDCIVTRGQQSLFAAHFIFAYALIRFCFAALRRDVDLLHIHLSQEGSIYRKIVLGTVARFFRIPYVLHLHGGMFIENWSAAPFYLAHAINGLFEKSGHIVVLGQIWARAIGNRLPIVANKMTVLANMTPSIRLDQSTAKDGRVRISCLGKLGQRKGTPQLIEALQRLAGRTDWTVTIAGDGNVEESRAYARSLGDRANIPGWLDSTAIENLLCCTDILVLPSFSEGLPMAIIEAFAHGIPVVCTPVGALPEVVDHGRNGLLVPIDDVPALADALKRLIENPELRRTLGQAARRDHAERFEISFYPTQLAAIWRRTVVSRNFTDSPSVRNWRC